MGTISEIPLRRKICTAEELTSISMPPAVARACVKVTRCASGRYLSLTGPSLASVYKGAHANATIDYGAYESLNEVLGRAYRNNNDIILLYLRVNSGAR